jgi:hypothetical protein
MKREANDGGSDQTIARCRTLAYTFFNNQFKQQQENVMDNLLTNGASLTKGIGPSKLRLPDQIARSQPDDHDRLYHNFVLPC